jgi:hypothetical protein
MLRRVVLVRIEVSEERSAYIIRVTRIVQLGSTLAARCVRRLLVTANVIPISLILVTLMMETIRSSETSVLTRAIRRNIPEYGFLHSYRRGNFKSYIALTGVAL